MNKLSLSTIGVVLGFVTMILLDVVLSYNDFGELVIYDKDYDSYS